MLNMIKDTMQKDISGLDFCGAKLPNPGDFKISLIAELKTYFICTY